MRTFTTHHNHHLPEAIVQTQELMIITFANGQKESAWKFDV